MKYRFQNNNVKKTIFSSFLFFLIIIYNNNHKKTVEYIDFNEKKINITNEFYRLLNNLLFLNISEYKDLYNIKYNYPNNSNNFLMCSICKNENKYAKEFIDYYYLLGFKKFIIFDNNDLEGERVEDVLQKYISEGIVQIIDIRGFKYIQLLSYNYCYRKNMNLYDWIAFFDFDEYLYIHNNLTIKNFFVNNDFSHCQSILFNWYHYNDNNLLKYDNRPINQRFTFLQGKSNMTKFIIRGNIKKAVIISSHFPNNTNLCNTKGHIYEPNSFKILPFENNSNAFLKHFRTKTAEEFCWKIKRGDVQYGLFNGKTLARVIKIFFSLNEKTKEKIKIFEKCLNITNLSSLNDLENSKR